MKTKKTLPFQSGEPFIPFSMEYYLKFNWWTTFEAACILTCWPQYEHAWSNITPIESIPEDIRLERTCFVLPSDKFNIKNYCQEFQDVFFKLNEDINNERIIGRHFLLVDDINKIVNPFDVILWAIKNGFELPFEVQNALSIIQIRQRQPKPWQNKVKMMIAGQYYKLFNPDASQKEIISSPWVREYSLDYNQENDPFEKRCQERQLLKDISLVFGNKKTGWNQSRQKISLKTIPQVLIRKEKIFHCDFELLNIVISTVAKIHSYEILGHEKICILTFENFMARMKKNKIISLYWKDSPKIISLFIDSIIGNIFNQIQDMFIRSNALKDMSNRFILTNEFFNKN